MHCSQVLEMRQILQLIQKWCKFKVSIYIYSLFCWSIYMCLECMELICMMMHSYIMYMFVSNMPHQHYNVSSWTRPESNIRPNEMFVSLKMYLNLFVYGESSNFLAGIKNLENQHNVCHRVSLKLFRVYEQLLPLVSGRQNGTVHRHGGR